MLAEVLMRLAAAKPDVRRRELKRLLGRHGAAEVFVPGAVRTSEDERHSGLEIKDLVAGVQYHASSAGTLHDVDRAVERHRAGYEVDLRGEVVVLVEGGSRLLTAVNRRARQGHGVGSLKS